MKGPSDASRRNMETVRACVSEIIKKDPNALSDPFLASKVVSALPCEP